MLYLQRIPGPPLDSFVAAIWFCENNPGPLALERVLPNGSAQLIVNLKEDQTRIYRPARGYACRDDVRGGAVGPAIAVLDHRHSGTGMRAGWCRSGREAPSAFYERRT